MKNCLHCYRWWATQGLHAFIEAEKLGLVDRSVVLTTAEAMLKQSPYNKEFGGTMPWVYIDDYAWYVLVFLGYWVQHSFLSGQPHRLRCLVFALGATRGAGIDQRYPLAHCRGAAARYRETLRQGYSPVMLHKSMTENLHWESYVHIRTKASAYFIGIVQLGCGNGRAVFVAAGSSTDRRGTGDTVFAAGEKRDARQRKRSSQQQ